MIPTEKKHKCIISVYVLVQNQNKIRKQNQHIGETHLIYTFLFLKYGSINMLIKNLIFIVNYFKNI